MEALLTGKNAQKLDAASVFSVSDIPDVKVCVAYTFALTGRDAEAAHLADELAKQRPQDTWCQAMFIPAIAHKSS